MGLFLVVLILAGCENEPATPLVPVLSEAQLLVNEQAALWEAYNIVSLAIQNTPSASRTDVTIEKEITTVEGVVVSLSFARYIDNGLITQGMRTALLPKSTMTLFYEFSNMNLISLVDDDFRASITDKVKDVSLFETPSSYYLDGDYSIKITNYGLIMLDITLHSSLSLGTTTHVELVAYIDEDAADSDPADLADYISIEKLKLNGVAKDRGHAKDLVVDITASLFL